MPRLPFLVVLSAVSCTSAPTVTPEPSTRPAVEPAAATPEPARDLAAELAAIEKRLLADGYHLRYTVEATGVVEAKVHGLISVGTDRVSLHANGSFAGAPITLAFESDGKRMRAEGGKLQIDLPTAPALAEAITLGLTRMGVLHNVAVLTGGRPPDHAEGGTDTWVVTRTHDDLPIDAGFEAPTSGRPLSFELMVADQPAGHATLFLDEHDLPATRHQVVDFPEGQMRVRETYEWSTL